MAKDNSGGTVVRRVKAGGAASNTPNSRETATVVKKVATGDKAAAANSAKSSNSAKAGAPKVAPSAEKISAKIDKKSSAKLAKPDKKSAKITKPKRARDPNKKPFVLFRPFCAVGRYFRDSWRELRQVRWTNRRATWALTLAVILFSAFFAIFVLLFDWLFQWIVKEVIL